MISKMLSFVSYGVGVSSVQPSLLWPPSIDIDALIRTEPLDHLDYAVYVWDRFVEGGSPKTSLQQIAEAVSLILFGPGNRNAMSTSTSYRTLFPKKFSGQRTLWWWGDSEFGSVELMRHCNHYRIQKVIGRANPFFAGLL